MKKWQKSVIAVLVSIVTGFGGHFVNRRWDRAVLFLGFAIVWAVGGAMVFMWWVAGGAGEKFFAYPRFMISGFAVVWLLSAVVTGVDAARGRAVTIARWTPSGLVGAVVLSLLGLAMTGYQYNLYRAMGSFGSGGHAAAGDVETTHYRFFHASTRFGGRSAFDGAPPPAGDGLITGRVMHNGEPAAGVTLKLYLNEQYRTEPVRTDAEGRYRVEVRPGAWRVNSVSAENWDTKPRGNFVMVSGHEPPLESGTTSLRHISFNDEPLALNVAVGRPGVLPDLELRPTLNLLWPEGERTSTSWGDDAIEWEPYPGATDYVVEIGSVTRKGRSTSYRSLLSRTVGDNRMPVSEMPAATADGVTSEYSVSIAAFDDEGRFLSESDRYTATFTLEDRMLVAEADGWPEPGESFDLATLDKKRKNTKRIDAAQLLIDEGMLDPAESLLGRIQGPVDPGEKEALEGYLRAEQGRCDEARALFEAAKAAGKRCIPERYEAACANKPPC